MQSVSCTEAVYVSGLNSLELTYKFIDLLPSLGHCESTICVISHFYLVLLLRYFHKLSPLAPLHTVYVISGVHLRQRHSECENHLAVPVSFHLKGLKFMRVSTFTAKEVQNREYTISVVLYTRSLETHQNATAL